MPLQAGRNELTSVQDLLAISKQTKFERTAVLWACALIYSYFIYSFFSGFSPFAGQQSVLASSEQGSFVNKLSTALMFCGCVPLLIAYRRQAWDLVRFSLPLLIVVSWFTVSVIWSQHPDLTLRRIIAYWMYLVIAIAAISTIVTPQKIVATIALVFATVIVFDFLALALFPAAATQLEGVRGIHFHKNDAGTVAMVSTFVLGGASFATKGKLLKTALFALSVASICFLILSHSKTTLGFTLILILVIPAIYLLILRSQAVLVTIIALIVGCGATLFSILILFDVSMEQILTFVFGDPTLTRRTDLWRHLLYSIYERPLLGSGWGAFWGTGEAVNPIHAPPKAWFLDAAMINTAHNGYLDVVLQSGLVGLVLTIALIIRCLWNYVMLLQENQISLAERRSVLVFFAVAIAILLNSTMESRIFGVGDPIARLFDLVYLCGECWRQQIRVRGRTQEVSWRSGRSARAEALFPAGTAER